MSAAIGAEAGRLDFIWQSGSTFKHLLTYKSGGTAVDLTGATATMEIRDRAGGTLLITVPTSIPAPATNGQILLEAGPALTATLLQSAYHDVKVTYADASVDRVVAGKVKLSAPITA